MITGHLQLLITSALTRYNGLSLLALITLLVYLCEVDTGHTLNGRLQLKSNCICPGYTLTFAECTIVGGSGYTIWRGTAFDCRTNEIILRHSHFNTAAGECNSGSIVGRGVKVVGKSYTSQLSITVNSDMIGKTIQCVYDNWATEEVIGTLIITKPGPFPPPNTLFISQADFVSRQITFDWSQVVTECPNEDRHYNINTSNCGSCPTTTNYTTVTCTAVPSNGNVCTFAVQTIVCENIAGNFSDVIHIALKDSTNSCTKYNSTCDSDNVGRSVFAGAIVSATLLGGIIGAGITIFTTISLQRKRKAQYHATTSKQESPDHQYEDVSLKQTSSTVIDTRKNVAYGQAAS